MPERSSQREIIHTHKGSRVDIYAEVYNKGATEKVKLPFTVGVLAALAGDRERSDEYQLKDREIHSIDRENFNSVMEKIAPELYLSVESVLPPGEERKTDQQEVVDSADDDDLVSESEEQTNDSTEDATGKAKKRRLMVRLDFKRMEDFEPERIARSVPKLADLLDELEQLQLFYRRLQANDRLKEEFEKAFDNKARLKLLMAEAQPTTGTD